MSVGDPTLQRTESGNMQLRGRETPDQPLAEPKDRERAPIRLESSRGTPPRRKWRRGAARTPMPASGTPKARAPFEQGNWQKGQYSLTVWRDRVYVSVKRSIDGNDNSKEHDL
jgi:hypothetical protein